MNEPEITQRIPLIFPKDVDPQWAAHIIQQTIPFVENAVGMLRDANDCRGFLAGAQADEIKVPDCTGLHFKDLIPICRSAIWQRFNQIIVNEKWPAEKARREGGMH